MKYQAGFNTKGVYEWYLGPKMSAAYAKELLTVIPAENIAESRTAEEANRETVS
jgi:hypothetical protein